MTSIYLWLDDERPMPKGFTHWVKTSKEAIEFLKNMDDDDFFVMMSFDHDLGFDPTDGHPKLEGPNPSYDDAKPVVRYMVKNNILPTVISIHSWNQDGMDWIYNAFKDARPGQPVVRQRFNPKNYN